MPNWKPVNWVRFGQILLLRSGVSLFREMLGQELLELIG